MGLTHKPDEELKTIVILIFRSFLKSFSYLSLCVEKIMLLYNVLNVS